jgi:hypothetical protein
MELHGWQDILTLVSAFACIAGLVLLFGFRQVPQVPADSLEEADQQLMAMVFAYWLVHCLAIAAIRADWISDEFVLNSVKMTSALTYFLTWASVFSLPLHRISTVRELE